MTNYKLTNSFIIVTFALCGLAACNSDDYKNYDSSDSANSNAVATDKTGTNKTNTDTTVTAPSPTMTPTHIPATASNKGTVAKKKGKTTIKMPAEENTAKVTKDKEGVYTRAEAMPQFPGGSNALDNYVNNNIDYPQKAIDDNISGTIRVSFVVDETGKVTKARIVGNKLGSGLDEQALKVVNNMPAWKPGKVNGKNVKTRLELPIEFQVEA